VPLTIFGGEVVAIISLILISGLSRACNAGRTFKLATYAPRPPVGGGLPCEEVPVRPEIRDAASPPDPLDPLELPDADPVVLELPDADPVVIRPGKVEGELSGGVFLG